MTAFNWTTEYEIETYFSSADGKPVIALIRENSKDPTLYDFHAAASHSPFSSQSQDQVNFLL